MGRFYLTTAIDYANGDPHIGHAYEKIGTDVIARYKRLSGEEVHFLTGMDEHGQKVAQAAADKGISPQDFVDHIAGRFRAMWSRLGISYDQFIRTTNADHKTGARALIKRIHASSPDDFYEKTYEGWYCVGCELFKRENEIANGKCVLHPTRDLQWTQERNWFFRLSHYSEFLKRLFAERPEFIQPEARRNEMLALLAAGLEDISITRSKLSWAIPFPIASSNGETQGTWVWFDALPNYLTATGLSRRRVARALAGGPARHRQGHQPPAHDRLAGHAAGGRAAASATGVGARVRELRRRALQQVGRREARSRGGGRPVRRRRVPLLPDARSSVRRGRQLQLGTVRGTVRRRPGQRVRQPGQPLDRHGRALP